MSSSATPHHASYPADVIEAIAAAVYELALPSAVPSLDPLYSLSTFDNTAPPTALPSTYPAPYWPERVSRKTLSTLCLVSKDFRDAARPWLWRRLEINIPRHWLAILHAICGEDEEPEKPLNRIDSVPIKSSVEDDQSRSSDRALRLIPEPSFESPLSPSSAAEGTISKAASDAEAALPTGLGPVPHDLLTPRSSRPPSPACLSLRGALPGRWRFIKAVNNIVHSEPGLYGSSLKLAVHARFELDLRN